MQGKPTEAFVDFSGTPSVAFQVLAYDTLEFKLKMAAPTSYSQQTPVATIFSELATKAAIAA